MDGRTARERTRLRGVQERTALMDVPRHRPLTLIKGFLGFAFVLLLAFALLGALR